MSHDRNNEESFSKYSCWALIGLSLIGLVSSFYREMPLQSTLLIIVTPYAMALFFGVALLLGKKWAALPISLISIFGVLLNIREVFKQGPNQKDIFEIILFLLIISLLVWDFARSKNELG